MDDDMKIVPDPAEEKEAATELDGQTAFEEVIDSGTLPPDDDSTTRCGIDPSKIFSHGDAASV